MEIPSILTLLFPQSGMKVSAMFRNGEIWTLKGDGDKDGNLLRGYHIFPPNGIGLNGCCIVGGSDAAVFAVWEAGFNLLDARKHNKKE